MLDFLLILGKYAKMLIEERSKKENWSILIKRMQALNFSQTE